MTQPAAPPPEVPVTARATTSLARRLLRHPVAAASLAYLALITVIAVLGRAVAPNDPNHARIADVLAEPGPGLLLGGDSSGRDVFSRLLAATQISLAASLVALVVALVLGVTTGLLAGYYKGLADGVFSWMTSLTMAMPGIIVLLAARSVIGPSVWWAMVIFGILLAPAFYRLTYAAVTAVREELYVDAARVSGLSDARIIGRHILTVVRAPLIIQSAMVLGIAIAIQSGLEFLGLGDMSVPTWGGMLNDGFQNIYREPLLMLWPSLAIGLTCIALTLFANAMRDELERSDAGAGSSRRRRALTERADHSVVVHADDDHSRSGEVLLEVIDVRVGYDQRDGSVTEVVKGVDLIIRRGEVHGLIGESGSGKTQTAFAVMGLLPTGGRVLDGSIRFHGDEMSDDPRAATALLGRKIAYIPQEPMSNLDPSFTIGYQLVEPMRANLRLDRRTARARALELLARVGIPEPERTFAAYPHEISGGMAQRVLIAGAVSTDPDLLIADEPTTALDVTVQAEVLDVLRSIQEERQMGVLLVSHNFGVVADLCDRVSVMQHGRIVETGPVRAILKAPEHPYTRSLIDSILEGGPARGPLPTQEAAR